MSHVHAQTDLTHVTSTTGDVTATPRYAVADDVVAALRPLDEWAEGGVVRELPEWYVDVWPLLAGGAAAWQVAAGPHTSTAGKIPYLMAVVCWRDDVSAEAWRQAHQVAVLVPVFGPNKLPAAPPPVPWLATTLMPGIVSQSPERAMMLGDFGRCMAWAIIETATEDNR